MLTGQSHIHRLGLGTMQNFIITPHSDDYPYKEGIEVTKLDTFLKVHLPDLLQ
jgi:hypothetical protein